MKTKNLFLFICASSLFLSGLKAQELRLQAGIGFPSTSIYWQEYYDNNDFVLNLGFQLGPTFSIFFDESNIIKLGALLNLKGHRVVGPKGRSDLEGYDDRMNLLYLDFPVLYCRKFELDNRVFLTEIGSYAGIGLNGKLKSEYYYKGKLEFEEYILFGKNNIDYFKTMDYGLLFGLSTTIKSCQLGFSFSLGLRDITKPDYDEIKNRVFTIYASYPLFSK